MGKRLLQCIILTMILGFTYNSLLADNWTKVEGTEQSVNKIIIFPNSPSSYAVASDLYSWAPEKAEPEFYIIDGKGFKITDNKGDSFNDAMLEGHYILDVMRLDNNTLIASTVNKTRGGIVKSTDNGATWNDAEVSFNNTYFVTEFAKSNNKLLATAMNTAKGILFSEDGFDTYITDDQLSISSRDISVSKLNEDLIFVAGDNSYSGGVLRSNDGGTTWEKYDQGIEGLRIHTVLASGLDEHIVYCGADSLTDDGVSFGKGIYQSLDTGKTWQSAGASGATIYSLAHHPLYPKFMVAAAGMQGTFVSANNGWWWEQYGSGLPDASMVTTVAAPAWDTTGSGAVFLAGTATHGLFESEPLKTDVNNNIIVNNSLEVENLYPAPVNDNFTLKWNNPEAGQVSIYISDLQGRRVANLISNYFPAGTNELNWAQAYKLAVGSYMLVLQSSEATAVYKFIKQ